MTQYGTSTGFEAIRRAGWKGWFLFPSLAPMRRMTPMTRDQVARAGQWLYDNTGLGGAIVDRLAIYEAGTGMWPKATTTSAAFNTAQTDLFHQGVHDPRFFDLARHESFYSAQIKIRRHIRLHGDYFGQLVRGPVPRMRFIPAYCIGNGADRFAERQGWRDGIRSDEFGAAIEYRVLSNESGSAWQDVPAEDMLHFHDHFLDGQTRGLSIFSRLAEKMFTIDDIVRAEANGMLARARMGYALTVPSDSGSGPSVRLPGTDGEEEIVEADGKKFTIQRVSFPGGDTMDVPELPPGYDIKTIESNRPGPNQLAFIGELKRDISLASGYTPEFIDFIAAVGGAVTRFVLEDTQMMINDKRQNQLQPQFAHRFYIFNTWQRIKDGQFDGLEGGVPADWWRYRMVHPRLITVDKKNDGRLDDSRVETGKMSPEKYHGQDGDDAEDVEDEIIAAAIRRRVKVAAAAAKAGVELSYDDVFRLPPGSAPSTSEQPIEPDEPPPVPKPEPAAA